MSYLHIVKLTRLVSGKEGRRVETLPWWIYLVIIGIIVSGYMVLYTSKKEQDMDNEFIEKEGEVYMKRLEEERERRNQESDKDSVLL